MPAPTQTHRPTATAALVEHATTVTRPGTPDSVPETVVAVARGLIDTFGVALAAREEPAVRILLSYLEAEESGDGPAVLWGQGRRVSRAQAALVNGTAAHALDWDDASPTAVMHPSAVLYPAVLAVTDEHSTVLDLVDAVDAGNAVFRAVSSVLDVGLHQDSGWHNTATTGRLACAVAVARMRRVDAQTAERALGIVASFTAGSLANFGTMTKPLHAGAAAHDAVRAVLLAERGFDAQPGQLDHAKGFFAAFPPREEAAPEDLAAAMDHWRTAWPGDVAVKRYPSCYGTHRAIDAMLALRERVLARVDDVDQVESIEVVVHPGGRRPLIDHLPTSGLEGKFSLEYTVARALIDGEVTLADFTDARVAEAEWLTARVRLVEVADVDAAPDVPTNTPVEELPLTGPKARYSVVRVHTGGGDPLTHRVDITHGDARNPLDDEGLVGKFVSAVAPAATGEAGSGDASTAQAAQLARTLMHLAAHGPVGDIPALLSRHPVDTTMQTLEGTR